MASSGAPVSSLRQMPVKVTTAPISPRPRRSLSTSLAASNGSRCSRTVAAMSVVRFLALAPRHRREKGDLVRAENDRVGAHMGAIDCCADHLRIFKGVGIFLAALAEPSHEIGDCHDTCGEFNLLLGLSDALAHPGEITKLQRSILGQVTHAGAEIVPTRVQRQQCREPQ